MKAYIGTKVILAEPMDEATFLAIYKGQKTDDFEQPRDGYRIEHPDGHISWSPAEEFERCYREVSEAEKFMAKHSVHPNQVEAPKTLADFADFVNTDKALNDAGKDWQSRIVGADPYEEE